MSKDKKKKRLDPDEPGTFDVFYTLGGTVVVSAKTELDAIAKVSKMKPEELFEHVERATICGPIERTE